MEVSIPSLAQPFLSLSSLSLYLSPLSARSYEIYENSTVEMVATKLNAKAGAAQRPRAPSLER